MVNIYGLLNLQQKAETIIAELGVDPCACIQHGSGVDNSSCFYVFNADLDSHSRLYWLNANVGPRTENYVSYSARRLQRLIDHHGSEMIPDAVDQIELQIAALLVQAT